MQMKTLERRRGARRIRNYGLHPLHGEDDIFTATVCQRGKDIFGRNRTYRCLRHIKDSAGRYRGLHIWVDERELREMYVMPGDRIQFRATVCLKPKGRTLQTLRMDYALTNIRDMTLKYY